MLCTRVFYIAAVILARGTRVQTNAKEIISSLAYEQSCLVLWFEYPGLDWRDSSKVRDS